MTDLTPPSPNPQPPANWYPDPTGQAQLRYWDGRAWTGHVAGTARNPQQPSKYDLPGGRRYVGPIRGFVLGFKQYAVFDGRASRSEFWWYWLLTYLILLVFVVPMFVGFISWISRCGNTDLTGSCSTQSFLALNLFTIPANLWSLAILVPSIAVSVRRLHDIGYSGVYYLFYLIPIVGLVLMIVWGARQGDRGPNQYGLEPAKGEPANGPSAGQPSAI